MSASNLTFTVAAEQGCFDSGWLCQYTFEEFIFDEIEHVGSSQRRSGYYTTMEWRPAGFQEMAAGSEDLLDFGRT